MKIKFFFLCLPLIISGCLNYEQEAEIYPDGSGKIKIHYWTPHPDPESLALLDKLGIFNPDSIRNKFSSAATVIEDVVAYTDTVDSTSHAFITITFNHVDSLNSIKALEDYEFTLRDGAAGQKLFSQFIPSIATGFGFDGSAYTVAYKFSFSGDIITHNATKRQGKWLIWEYNLSEIGGGKTISVTFRPYKLKETPYWIYALSGFVLLVVIFFLLRKKKD